MTDARAIRREKVIMATSNVTSTKRSCDSKENDPDLDDFVSPKRKRFNAPKSQSEMDEIKKVLCQIIRRRA